MSHTTKDAYFPSQLMTHFTFENMQPSAIIPHPEVPDTSSSLFKRNLFMLHIYKKLNSCANNKAKDVSRIFGFECVVCRPLKVKIKFKKG